MFAIIDNQTNILIIFSCFCSMCSWSSKAGADVALTKMWDLHLMEPCTLALNFAWWRHQMERFSALVAIYAGNSPVPCEFPAQRPVTRSFDVFFDLRLNKRLSKQSWGWWFETLSHPLWRRRNGLWISVAQMPVDQATTWQKFNDWPLHAYSVISHQWVTLMPFLKAMLSYHLFDWLQITFNRLPVGDFYCALHTYTAEWSNENDSIPLTVVHS